jgi:hypothetical protein
MQGLSQSVALRRVDSQLATGDANSERAALAFAFTCWRHRSTVILNDAMSDTEPEASALPCFLSGEERVEDVLQRFRIHAAAVVGHNEQKVVDLLLK